MSSDHYSIADAAPGDVPEILAMIRELAEFEKLEHLVVASEERLHESFFADPPSAEALVARVDGEAVGYAVLFTTFSTFIGKSGLWLEDLYVRPEHRGKGIGKALLKAGGARARDRGCDRYEWCVLDWNQNAIDVYQSMGADVMKEWRIARLDRSGIEALQDK
jgi:GNAT superfamily N-acetyltransferase